MTILHMSVSASILILVITVIRAVMLNRLPKKAFLVLWGVALLRLLIPFNLPSEFSFFTMVSKAMKIISPENQSPVINIGNGQNLVAGAEGIGNVALQAFIPLFLVVWLVGMSGIALFFIITHLRCRQKYKMALPIENDFITLWQQKHVTKRKIQIKQSDRISTPMTYGVLHPVVLLPKSMDYSDENQLQYVLAHEFTHIKRFDIPVKCLLAVCLCIHWFNPIVWVMYVIGNRDIEISCDETVVRMFGEKMSSNYALALINLEEKKMQINPLCSNFSKNAIEERITSIMKIKKVTALSAVAALVLVIGTTSVFATSAKDFVKPTPSTEAVATTNASVKLEQQPLTAATLVDAMEGDVSTDSALIVEAIATIESTEADGTIGFNGEVPEGVLKFDKVIDGAGSNSNSK